MFAMNTDNRPMLVGEVAKELGCSTARVKQMDDALTPTRTAGGNGTRLYDRSAVARLKAERAARVAK